MHQQAKYPGDPVAFPAGSNNTSGSGDDGASAQWFVRRVGEAGTAAPALNGLATLLEDALYSPGSYEINIDTSTLTPGLYLVFFTLAVDSQNPTGAVGSFSVGHDPEIYATVDDAVAAPTPTSFRVAVDALAQRDDEYKNLFVMFVTGNLAGISRMISTYVQANDEFQFNGADSNAIDAAWPEAPADGDVFLITGRAGN